MWVARIRLSSHGLLIGGKAQEFGVNLFGFPLSFYYENDWVVVHVAGTLLGEDLAKNRFVRALRKESRVLYFEVKNDFFLGMVKEPGFTRVIYSKDIIHVSPALISSDGYELLTLGSFTREPLMKLIRVVKQRWGGVLLSLQQKKLGSVSVMRVHPELTEKQREAMRLAVEHGYIIVFLVSVTCLHWRS